MRSNYLFALLTLFSTIVLTAQADAAPAEGSLLIRNVHIITEDAKVSKHVTNVLVERGRIAAIGNDPFKADTIIDGNGQFLTPGLIDTHVHLLDVPGLMLPLSERTSSALYQEATAQIPKSYLYAGFTTVLDLINTRDFIDQWNHQAIAPTAYFCSPVIIPHGYPVAILPPDMQALPMIADHYVRDTHSHPATSTETAVGLSPTKLVAQAKNDGARCIKMFYERGFGPFKNLQLPSEAIVREVVAAAHKQKLPVFLHSNSHEAYEFALKAGVDMIVHGLWNGDATTTPDAISKIANKIVKNGTSVQPTVQVIYGLQEFSNPDFFNDPYLKQVMPASLIKWYMSEDGQWMAREMADTFNSDSTPVQRYEHVKATYQPPLDRVKLLTQQVYANKKSLLVFGTDTPSGPMYTQFPGFNGRQEMNHWLAMGISLTDLFKAMTTGNAKRMGLENELGGVTKNKVADLLLMAKNPLEDITAYDSINFVIVKGKAIKREELSALNSK